MVSYCHYSETLTNVAGTNVAWSNVRETTNQISKFGCVLTSNIRDMASYCHYTETWTNVEGTNVAWSNYIQD